MRRKYNRLPYTLDNITFACRRCNNIKGSWFTEKQMLEIANRYFKKPAGVKLKVHIDNNKDWGCPYCGVIAWNGENKLRHLAKHEPAIAKMLKRNFILKAG